MIDNMWFDILQKPFCKMHFHEKCYCHCQHLLSLVSPSLWVDKFIIFNKRLNNNNYNNKKAVIYVYS